MTKTLHHFNITLVILSQEEKRKMKEEIERRRAEAAEKRQKVDDTMDGEGKPFKCVSPRGSSLKVNPPAFSFYLCHAFHFCRVLM